MVNFNSEWLSYWETEIEMIEGWLDQGVKLPLERVAAVQADRSISGAVLEVGVHHGKFFIPLALLTNPQTEACVAIDIFDDQEKNIDFSGYGSRSAFQRNIDRYCPNQRIHAISADSIAMNAEDRMGLLSRFGSFRLASIDGGHTVEHTVNDFLLVQELLCGGGVIVVDDYYNAHWPGVHEGINRLYALGTPKLKPFCATCNKLFFTDLTHHSLYLNDFKQHFSAHANYKQVQMFGSPVVVF